MTKNNTKKDDILLVALDLFKKHGFHETTMRMIAKEAQISLGSSYWYYESKEDLILYFYQKTAQEDQAYCLEIVKDTKSIKERLKLFIKHKQKQFGPHRDLLKILASNAADIEHPLSPFAKQTSSVRDNAIDNMNILIEGSSVKYHKSLEQHIAKLLWLYHMFILYYWSIKPKKVSLVFDLSLELMLQGLKLSTIPLVNRYVCKVSRLIELV